MKEDNKIVYNNLISVELFSDFIPKKEFGTYLKVSENYLIHLFYQVN